MTPKSKIPVTLSKRDQLLDVAARITQCRKELMDLEATFDLLLADEMQAAHEDEYPVVKIAEEEVSTKTTKRGRQQMTGKELSKAKNNVHRALLEHGPIYVTNLRTKVPHHTITVKRVLKLLEKGKLAYIEPGGRWVGIDHKK